MRRCIGAGFSLMEGVVVLREVLTAYTVESLTEDRPQVRNITSVPRDGRPDPGHRPLSRHRGKPGCAVPLSAWDDRPL